MSLLLEKFFCAKKQISTSKLKLLNDKIEDSNNRFLKRINNVTLKNWLASIEATKVQIEFYEEVLEELYASQSELDTSLRLRLIHRLEKNLVILNEFIEHFDIDISYYLNKDEEFTKKDWENLTIIYDLKWPIDLIIEEDLNLVGFIQILIFDRFNITYSNGFLFNESKNK